MRNDKKKATSEAEDMSKIIGPLSSDISANKFEDLDVMS